MSQDVPTEKSYEAFTYEDYSRLIMYSLLLAVRPLRVLWLKSKEPLQKVKFERKNFDPEDLKKIQDKIFGKLIKFLVITQS